MLWFWRRQNIYSCGLAERVATASVWMPSNWRQRCVPNASKCLKWWSSMMATSNRWTKLRRNRGTNTCAYRSVSCIHRTNFQPCRCRHSVCTSAAFTMASIASKRWNRPFCISAIWAAAVRTSSIVDRITAHGFGLDATPMSRINPKQCETQEVLLKRYTQRWNSLFITIVAKNKFASI